jgi:porin
MGSILSVKTAPFTWTLMVYDPNDRTDDYWVQHLFDDGVDISLAGKYDWLLAGRTSSLTLTCIYSTKKGADLRDLLLPSDLRSGTKADTGVLSLQFTHLLREIPAKPGDGWGLFVKAGGTGGNPNPYLSFVTGGIGGKGLFAFRPNDTFGLGYFYYNFSDDLQGAVKPLGKFDDEQGVELFYNVAVTPWFHLGVDL